MRQLRLRPFVPSPPRHVNDSGMVVVPNAIQEISNWLSECWYWDVLGYRLLGCFIGNLGRSLCTFLNRFWGTHRRYSRLYMGMVHTQGPVHTTKSFPPRSPRETGSTSVIPVRNRRLVQFCYYFDWFSTRRTIIVVRVVKICHSDYFMRRDFF